MKKILLFVFVLATILAFTSCGGDDDPNRPTSVTATKEFVIDFMIGANQPTSASITMNLSDFSELKDYVKYVNKGTINVATSTITITGITAGGYELKDAKLVTQDVKTNGTLDFKTLTADKTFTTPDDINYLQATINKMVASDRATAIFSISSANKDISRTVKVKIKMNVVFSLD